MRKLGPFVAALAGDDETLRNEAGPDALIEVAPDLSSVLVVQEAGNGTQTGTIAIVGSESGGGDTIRPVHVPVAFRVARISRDGKEFVLTAVDGRTVHGTPDQFAANPRLLPDGDDPRNEEQRDRIFMETHLLPPERFPAFADSPVVDVALSAPEALIEAGEATVTLGDRELWLDFESAGPGKVAQQLPHVRGLLADIERIGREGAEYLWSKLKDGDDTDEDEAEFLKVAVPTSLVVYVMGDFAVHYEETTEIYCMDGYWYAVQFSEDRTPVDYTVEA